ncbi:MAG: type II toxin-antitoxin system PemK/MazF family toxin [Bacteroidia bacterium]|nr:type II toxin-antitoxin system PemK/MazF family toxin [Bacteroidia bacterium]MCF8428241.1 type II toxin-antitoxin system PemK/MazF family toxin [Bacteroidia bacterium]MCF8448184.1 type II toxin-antitoxin system PemK/MazF family toxin [Bacteroidia bacterium]
MTKGDIVLIIFPFTDLSGQKLRPAVVLAETNQDFTVCFISSQLQWQETTDLAISPSLLNGLKKASLVRVNKIAILVKKFAKGLLGQLTNKEIKELNLKLKIIFQIP